MSDTLITYLNSGNHNEAVNLSGGRTSQGLAFPFTGVTGKITSVKFYLGKSGTPTGSAYAKLYTVSSLKPNTLLATSDSFNVSTISSGGFYEVFFSGGSQYVMTPSTSYMMSIEYTGGSFENYIIGATENSNGATLNTATWFINNGNQFYLYGVVPIVYTLTAEVGAFALTSINITMSHVRHLIAEVGAFVITMQDMLISGTGNWSRWKDQVKHFMANITNQNKTP